MFFHLQYIHLFRPFLKYGPSTSPLPAHVSPRRICTANAGSISKLMRLYKKTWGLRQICNIAVYMTHSACTIHLLNLPEKTAKRDITHGVKHLEEVAEDWLCARRTLSILSVLARKWKCELPEDAAFVLQRTDEKYGEYSTSDVPSPQSAIISTPTMSQTDDQAHNPREYSPLSQYTQQHLAQQQQQQQQPLSTGGRMIVPPPVHMMNDPRLSTSQQDMAVDMGFSPNAMAGWSPPPQNATSPTPVYPNTFAPAPRGSISRDPNTQNVASNVQGVNMDSQDWFIHDSARWHQGFESWNTGSIGGAAPGGGSMFVFGDNGTNGGVTSARPDSGEQLAGFDGLNDTLNAGGWLPGLD